MASIILPSRWTSQPQYQVEIAPEWKNHGAVLWTPSASVAGYDAANNILGVNSGLTSDAGTLGRAAVSDGSSTYGYVPINKVYEVLGFSLVVAIKPANTTQTNKVICGLSSTTDNDPLACITQEGTQLSLYFRNDAASVAITNASQPSLDVGLTTDWQIVCISVAPSAIKYFRNGIQATTRTGTSWSGGTNATFNRFGVGALVRSSIALHWAGQIAFAYEIPRALTDAEGIELTKHPWQIFRPQKRVLYFDVANGGGVTGTISATWENFTSSITGTTTVVGAISQTLSNFTSSIDGYPVTTGTIAQTLENYTSTISGSPIDSGTISQTLEDYTSNISGSIGSAVSGTIAVTLENFTQSAQGTTTVIGNMAVNLNDFTSAITGTTTVIGTSNISLDPFIMTANGYPGDVVLIRIRTLVGAGE